MAAIIGFAAGCVAYQMLFKAAPDWVDAFTAWMLMSAGWLSCKLFEVSK